MLDEMNRGPRSRVAYLVTDLWIGSGHQVNDLRVGSKRKPRPGSNCGLCIVLNRARRTRNVTATALLWSLVCHLIWYSDYTDSVRPAVRECPGGVRLSRLHAMNLYTYTHVSSVINIDHLSTVNTEHGRRRFRIINVRIYKNFQSYIHHKIHNALYIENVSIKPLILIKSSSLKREQSTAHGAICV